MGGVLEEGVPLSWFKVPEAGRNGVESGIWREEAGRGLQVERGRQRPEQQDLAGQREGEAWIQSRRAGEEG